MFHSGFFPSSVLCKITLSRMLMGNVLLFLFAEVLLFWFCLCSMENSTSLGVGVLSIGHLAIAHIFLILITWWQGNPNGIIFPVAFEFNNSERKTQVNCCSHFYTYPLMKDDVGAAAPYSPSSQGLDKGQMKAFTTHPNKLIWMVSHILHTVVRNGNLSSKTCKRAINNFNNISVIGL